MHDQKNYQVKLEGRRALQSKGGTVGSDRSVAQKIETRFTSILSYNPKHEACLHQQQPPAKGEGKDPFPQVRTKNTFPSLHTTRSDPREGHVVPQLGRRDLSPGLLRRHASSSADVKKARGGRTPLFFFHCL